MPQYDFRCTSCHKRFNVYLSYDQYDHAKVTCPHCGSIKVKRLINRVRIKPSFGSQLDDISDPSQLEGLENDPKTLGKMMRQMRDETGEDLGPEFEEVIGRLEKGHNPEEIAESMPDDFGSES